MPFPRKAGQLWVSAVLAELPLLWPFPAGAPAKPSPAQLIKLPSVPRAEGQEKPATVRRRLWSWDLLSGWGVGREEDKSGQ